MFNKNGMWILSFLSSAPCALYQFECSSPLECVNHYKRCDGNNDCVDGSDETDCGKRYYCIIILLM